MSKHPFILILVILCSCQRSETLPSASEEGNLEMHNDVQLVPSEYVQWIQDPENGMKKVRTIEDISYTVQYKPHQYLICVEERKDELSETHVLSRLKELQGAEYFELKIGLVEGQGELLKYKLPSTADYEARVKYFAFEMQNDIQLVYGTDTIPCSMYHFERAYDVSPHSKIMLGFDNGGKNDLQDMTLIVHDKIFGKGIIKFRFTRKELSSIPKLKTI